MENNYPIKNIGDDPEISQIFDVLNKYETNLATHYATQSILPHPSIKFLAYPEFIPSRHASFCHGEMVLAPPHRT
jgi:hypothetical protein